MGNRSRVNRSPPIAALSPAGDDLVPLKPKFRRRFHLAVVLLISLNKKYRDFANGSSSGPREPQYQHDGPSFQSFVNRLAEIMDNEHGGRTVSSLVVLQAPSEVSYVFASNDRKESELRDTKTFLESLLGDLTETLIKEARPLKPLFARLLHKIVVFNTPRLLRYVPHFTKNMAECLASMKGADAGESAVLLKSQLEGLQDKTDLDWKAMAKTGQFVPKCIALIEALNDLDGQKSFPATIDEKLSEYKPGGPSHWCEMRHSMYRILSYYKATRTIIAECRRKPQLIEETKLEYIPSSTRESSPFAKGTAKIPNAHDIIGRMTSDPEQMATARTHAAEVERAVNLDGLIEETCLSKNYNPIVHSEVLLLDWLVREKKDHLANFFDGERYIGSSKPTCRLCRYYFDFHGSEIKARATHGNVYKAWRAPDVYSSQGKHADHRRTVILNNVLDKIRQDAFRTLRDKLPDVKTHDSDTFMTPDRAWLKEERALNNLATIFERQDLEDDSQAENGDHDSLTDDERLSEDEDEGGARL